MDTTATRGSDSRWLMWAAAAALCILAGAAMLGYLAWQLVGTDIVARQRQADIRADLRASWLYPTVTDVLGPEGAVATLGDAEALVRVPRFGADYEMPVIEGVRDSDLAQGIGHFPGTGPGQIGNFAISGHQGTHGEPFKHLAALEPGDLVIVETAEATYTYRMDTDPDDLVLSFGEGWVTDVVPLPPSGQAPPGMPELTSGKPTVAMLTVTTCSELFHADERLVAFGHLIEITPK